MAKSRVFGKASTHLIERSALFVSAAVRLELPFLHEIGRLSSPAEEILGSLNGTCGAKSAEPLRSVVSEAVDLTWTRDPFDRWIVVAAKLHRAKLVTRDENIQTDFADAVW